MGIIIDTGVFYAYYNRDDVHHAEAQTIYQDIMNGKYGKPILLDYVFDELLTLFQVRTNRHDLATAVGSLLLDQLQDLLTMVYVSADVFESAWELFQAQSGSKYLSFTDCTIIQSAKLYDVEYIAAFDGLMKSHHAVISS